MHKKSDKIAQLIFTACKQESSGRDAGHVRSGLKLSEVNLLVRADRHDDGLHAVKVDVVDRAQVARQLVHNFSEKQVLRLELA